jgi:hypothetical protein
VHRVRKNMIFGFFLGEIIVKNEEAGVQKKVKKINVFDDDANDAGWYSFGKNI